MTTDDEFGNNSDGDVVEQILSFLPPKALMRFKCVSKWCYALTTNPRFVAMHFSNSNSNSMHNNLSTTCVVLKRFAHKDTNSSNETNDEAEEVFSFLHFRNDNDHDDNDVDGEGEGGVHEHSFLFSTQDMNILLSTGLKTRPESLSIIGHCNGIICLAHSISGEVILCNPAIQEFKLLPSSPYLPDSEELNSSIGRFIDALGFGYDPNLNQYKLVNIGLTAPEFSTPDDGFNIYLPPKAAVHSVGTDSWREIKTDSLETETSILWPEYFQMHFKEMCYWLGREQHKELNLGDAGEEEFIRNDVIIMFDTVDELFHDAKLPDSLYDPAQFSFGMRLLVWNESIALFVTQHIHMHTHFDASYGIWVMDEFGAWTKHITFEPTDQELPLAFWKSDEIIMNDRNGRILSYNLVTEKLNYLPIQSKGTKSAVVYVNSIVSVLGGCSSRAEIILHPIHSMMEKKSHSYSVWVFPSNDISLIIKKVMEGLRAEFSGSEIEPHITLVGSICMPHEDMLNQFRSLWSNVSSYKAQVNQVYTFATGLSGVAFGFWNNVRPHLSLLYGYLTEEERKKAQERVSILDESISSLSFPLTQLALYKIDYKDTSLKSWEKIAEYPLQFE